MTGWIIALIVLGGVGIAGGIGWSKLMKEHQEARNVSLSTSAFEHLQDGVYRGTYAGGMYQWRKNECEVTVAGNKVTEIQLVLSQDPGGKNAQHTELFERVIKAQSLQVDTISMATLTSKAYLKSVEHALRQAQQS